MAWDNSLFDEAFDAAGIREEVTLYRGGLPLPSFRARFDRPQQIMLDDQIHTTDYTIEYTTADCPDLEMDDEVDILDVTYTVKEPPVIQGDGHWTIALLEPKS